ncbi:MAG: T9SS type A sorting domain-containing protein [Bacteroidota bacterium]|nr:T9SS type A sorting domain-containing protein [Bacteroidota bacterium]
MKKVLISCLFLCLSVLMLPAQVTSKSKAFNISEKAVVTGRGMPGDFDPSMEYKVLPKPHPGTDRATVNAIKAELNKYRANRSTANTTRTAVNADPAVLYRNFLGNAFTGFVPNDNDVAVSNGDQVCSVTNTSIWSRDQVNNMTYGTFNLHTITSSLGLQQEEFDPKVLYDPSSNRFIMVCLNGFTDTTSNILLGFSQDSTSYNGWNFYALPGNPLNNNLWTDFPMISVTDDELFITVNLLYNDSTWQAGFNQTVIWQIPKIEGYTGVTLNPLLHYDILHNNEPLRNLCPVKGGSTTYGPNQYFLSNRNFALENDTIFLVEVSGVINTPPPTVTVSPVVSNLGYRMPVNALQPFADSLIVNDARILGAYYENNSIQFVFNTLDTTSGQVVIYHGTMDLQSVPTINASLYVNDTLDLAYPNIAYAGTGPADNTAVISVLMSSPTLFPGTAAFKYDGAGLYSPLTIIKTGMSYTNMLVGNERWGDYTGCQTRYNMPGWVWVNGSYSLVNHTTRTWIGELTVSSGVSVNEIQAADVDLNLYPNPSEERVSIDFNAGSDGLITIIIYTMEGKEIKQLYSGSLTKGSNSFSFNITSLVAGNYFVTIHDAAGSSIATQKFVKN